MLINKHLTQAILSAAIEVHKAPGPDFLESAYEEYLGHEFHLRGLEYKRQVLLPIVYKNTKLDCGYRLDVVVEDTVILELKSIEELLPIHEAQLLTYLRLSGKRVGQLIHFNVATLQDGIVRRV